MVMIESDGFGEALDDIFRVAIMEGSRVAEAWLRANQETKRQAGLADKAVAEAAARRLESNALISQAKLAPVMGESWWDRATPKMAAAKYAEAKAWDGVDPRFVPYVERIEEQAKAKFDMSPEELGKLDVATGVDKNGEVKAMTVDDAKAIAREKAPAWYKVHESLDGDLTEVARAGESARLIEDMMALQKDGKLDTDSARDEWAKFARGDEIFRPKRDRESVESYMSSRREAVNDLWDKTAGVRASVSKVPENASEAEKEGKDGKDGNGPERGAEGRGEGQMAKEASGQLGPLVKDSVYVASETEVEEVRFAPTHVREAELPQEEARKERKNESLVERAARKFGWDSKERREARESELRDTPGVSADARNAVMTADRNAGVKRGEVHERKGKNVSHAVRNKGRGKGQDQAHERGR